MYACQEAGDTSGETHIWQGVFTQWLEMYAGYTAAVRPHMITGHCHTQIIGPSVEYSNLRHGQWAHLPRQQPPVPLTRLLPWAA